MKVRISPGKYVVAVSGGVDSMVLLNVLRQNPRLELIVAHFDHGIRPDAAEDRKLVQRIAKAYDLSFVHAEGHLGAKASEALARAARYEFLRKVQAEHGAKAIITAHHQDDMLETAIMNLLRGTGRRGLSSLRSRKDLIRPLLDWTKKDIRTYAEEHDLVWAEDSTNNDEHHLRNYIRHNILARFTKEGREALLHHMKQAGKVNDEIDSLLDKDLAAQPAKDELSRSWYLQLPYAVASEMMAAWLRRNGILQFDRHLIDRLVVAAKTARPGKLADINSHQVVEFTRDKIKLIDREQKPGVRK
jgi:tRNA(Ile)-lysidine synthetase-like protein